MNIAAGKVNLANALRATQVSQGEAAVWPPVIVAMGEREHPSAEDAGRPR